MPFYDFWREKRVTPLGRRWGRLSAEFTLERVERAAGTLRSVVEIGPGRGALARACQARGVSYTAVDVNAGLLRSMKQTDGVCAFVPPLPLRDALADAVIANHVLEHAAGLPQATAMVAEMRRIARPGGVVAITSPDLVWVGPDFWDCDYSHNFPTSARRLQQLFLDQGLTIRSLGYVHNHLTGLAGTLAGWGTRALPYRLADATPHSRGYIEPLYKLRMTFARSVVIVGQRPPETARGR